MLFEIGSALTGITISAVGGFCLLYYVYPHHFIELAFALQRYKIGMKMKSVRNGKTVFCYAEKNSFREDKPTLFFLHGFTASFHQWIVPFKYLKTNHHMIALDLPGHGGSSAPSESDELTTEYMTQTLCDFLDTIGLKDKKVHVIGTSLGGALAGVFAARHPERTEKVTMVCPAMATPVETEFSKDMKKIVDMDPEEITHGHCILLPQDVPGLITMFRTCMYTKDANLFPHQIIQGILNLRLPKNDFYLKLLKVLNTTENMELLAKCAPSMKIPSHIIWGKDDEIMSSSGAEYLKSLLPDCQRVDILDKCGHAIDLERPFAYSKALASCIQEDDKQN